MENPCHKCKRRGNCPSMCRPQQDFKRAMQREKRRIRAILRKAGV